MTNSENREGDNLFQRISAEWQSIAQETAHCLGLEKALHVASFHSRLCLDINGAVISTYNRSERINFVYLAFLRIIRDLLWLQYLFQGANYLMLLRTLRYILEMMAQAFYVDAKFGVLTMDSQCEKAAELEDAKYGWRMVEAALYLLPTHQRTSISEACQSTWRLLNKTVHPSQRMTDLIMEEDPMILFTDRFNQQVASITLQLVDEVFDLLYVFVLTKHTAILQTIQSLPYSDRIKMHLPLVSTLLLRGINA